MRDINTVSAIPFLIVLVACVIFGVYHFGYIRRLAAGSRYTQAEMIQGITDGFNDIAEGL